MIFYLQTQKKETWVDSTKIIIDEEHQFHIRCRIPSLYCNRENLFVLKDFSERQNIEQFWWILILKNTAIISPEP